MQKNKETKILFLDILTGDKKSRMEINQKVYKGKTYADIMRSALGLRKNEFISIDASYGVFPLDLQKFNGIIIGGSTVDPVPGTEKPRWVLQTYSFIRKAVNGKIPILGICGGLQFTVAALGGTVILNPKGREFGSIDLMISKEGKKDKIFAGLPAKIIVASSHKCMAKKLKPDWKLLASSNLCQNQAVAIGDNIRLLQFHPEKKAVMLERLAGMRKEPLLREGFFKDEKDFQKFKKSIKNTEKAGRKILHNFLRYFVLSRS